MRRMRTVFLTALMLGVSPAALHAQDVVPDDEGEEIVVTGQAERGSVPGDIKPEQQLSPADVRAYGVSSVSELIDALAPQTNASGGAPVVLLNGKRISGFSEIRDLPSEAIQRVDILPEEVSLKFGYAANQKVVNIVLRQRFRAYTSELRGGITTEGGRESGQVNAALLRIQGDNRLTLDIKYAKAADLLESERDILPASPRLPYSLGGNITGINGAQIDPALSALAGTSVTVAAVPGSAANGRPALADFVAGANAASLSDLARYRTLSPATENLTVNATLARTLPGDISASFNAVLERSQSDSLQGLSGVSLLLPAGNPFSPFGQGVTLNRYLEEAGALAQASETTNIRLGASFSGMVDPWRWSFTGGYDRSETNTRTDRGVDTTALQSALNAGGTVNPFGAIGSDLLATRLTDTAEARSSTLTGDLLFSGPLFTLPAGKATSSIRVGGTIDRFESESLRGGVSRPLDYGRETASGQVNIDLPIASRRLGVLDAIGDLSLNANAGVQHFSDFGTLTTLGYGLRWTPIPEIRFIASMSNDKAAPTGQQVNNPQLLTPNVSVFDYRTGETVFVSQLSGGNPLLRESDREVIRLGVTLKPFDKPDFTLTANYTHSKTDNPIASFPSPTPQIEDAFPQRFLRDASGRLIQIDTTPVNFASATSSQLRWGINLSVPLKSAMQKQVEAWRAAGSKPEDRPAFIREMEEARARRQAEREARGESGEQRPEGERGPRGDGPRRDGPREGGPRFGPGGPGGFGGGFGGRGGGGGGGRLQFGLFHTWQLSDTILIAPGVPKLDLLDGAATGSSGGTSRHRVELQAGYNNNGLGVRLSGNWRSGTRVDGALGANSTLYFSDLATADLRIFADLGQMRWLVGSDPFFRGARVSLSVTNLFDSKQTVRDAAGGTPLRYQPDYLDPLGRAVTISFRKLFF